MLNFQLCLGVCIVVLIIISLNLIKLLCLAVLGIYSLVGGSWVWL